MTNIDINKIKQGIKYKNVAYSGEYKALATNKPTNPTKYYVRFNNRSVLELDDLTNEEIEVKYYDEIHMTQEEYEQYKLEMLEEMKQDNLDLAELILFSDV